MIPCSHGPFSSVFRFCREGKRGACCGVFQQVIARKEKKEHLRDICVLLRNNVNSPQSEFMLRVMKKWAADNGQPNGGRMQ